METRFADWVSKNECKIYSPKDKIPHVVLKVFIAVKKK